MLPAFAEIVSNVIGLQLAPDTTAAVLGAVLAPLLRSGPDVDPASEDPTKIQRKRARRPRVKSKSAPRRRLKKSKRRASRPSEARERALAALKANPDATLAHVAKLAKCSPSTVVNARKDLAKEARKEVRRENRKSSELSTVPTQARIGGSKTAKPTERRQRAQQFLKDTLAHGPKRASDVEEAAAKAHIDDQALTAARADLGIVASRSNAGVQAVQWSLLA
jgi:hypothetical protein